MHLHYVSIRLQILGLAVLLLGLMLVTTVYTVDQLHRIGDQLTAVTEDELPLITQISGFNQNQIEQGKHFERALKYAAMLDDDDNAATGLRQTSAEFDNHGNLAKAALERSIALAAQATEHAQDDVAHQLLEQIAQSLQTLVQGHASVEQRAGKALTMAERGDVQGAEVLGSAIEGEADALVEELERLQATVEKFTEHATLAAENAEQSALTLLLGIIAVAIVIGVGAAWSIANGVTRSLAEVIAQAGAIAAGDLTRELPARGNTEIGQLFTAIESMRDGLRSLVNELNDSSSQLAAASEELSTVSERTNRNLNQQQLDVEQVATAINEMTATVHEVANNAGRTSEAATRANDEAANESRLVRQTVATIEALTADVNHAAEVIGILGEHSNNIGTVLEVIKNIAEQTNLLALNAAIEAARAGEQGRGFAVVADEVRTLAKRTQESTQEIHDMIAKLQNGTHDAAAAIEKGRKQADEGLAQIHHTGEKLIKLSEYVGTINDMNAQIAAAAEEQTSVAEEINRNVMSVRQIGEQNAAAINQTTASSENLSRMAQGLRALIGRFRVG